MRCADLDELISAYADRQTVPAQAEFLEAHLATCSRCQDILQRHQQTRRLLHLAGDDAWSPPDLRLRVAHAYRRQARASRRPRLLAGLAVAVVAMAVLVVGLLGSQGLTPYSEAPVPSVSPVGTKVRVSSNIHSGTLATTLSSCYRPSGKAMAHCLGVPPYLLATVLADEFDVASTNSRAFKQPSAAERSSPISKSSNSALKGGGARTVSNTTHRGLQAV